MVTGSPLNQVPSHSSPQKVCLSILPYILLVVIGNSANLALTASLNLVPSRGCPEIPEEEPRWDGLHQLYL